MSHRHENRGAAPANPPPLRPWVEAERMRGWAWRVMVVRPLASLVRAGWRRAAQMAPWRPDPLPGRRPLSPYAVGAGLLGIALLAAAAASGADRRVACTAAELAVQAKLRPFIRGGDPGAAWLAASMVASARIARGYCGGERPEMGVTIYRRIIDTLDSYGPSVETAFQFQGDKGD